MSNILNDQYCVEVSCFLYRCTWFGKRIKPLGELNVSSKLGNVLESVRLSNTTQVYRYGQLASTKRC
jgi:hypothetical protein